MSRLRRPDADERWYIKKISGNEWIAETRSRTEHITSAHCTACALAELVNKRGGDVDLRGIHHYGVCGQFLTVLVRSIRDAEGEKRDD